MENSISKIVRKLTKQYREENQCTLRQINNGLCSEFVDDLLAELGGYGPETYDLVTDNFFNLMGEEGSAAALKDDNGKYYFENYGVFPNDLDPDGFYDIGNHIWLYHQGKHYDAEAPEGVTNFFDLPIFQRAINRYRRKQLQNKKPDFFTHKTLNEGLNLTKKKLPDWRYFELRICPWGWTDNDECDGDWDFLNFKVPGKYLTHIESVFGQHDNDTMYDILRIAIYYGIINKNDYDRANEIVEMSREEYCNFYGDCDEEIMEGLNLPKKTYYPYAIIGKMVNELFGKHRKQMLEQGWYIFSSNRTPKFEEIHGTSKDGYYLVVEKIDEPEIFDGELPVGELYSDLEAYSFARALGIMITDDGIIYGFNGKKVKPTIHEGLNIPKKKPTFTYEDIKSQFNLLMAEKSRIEKRITEDNPTSHIMLRMYDILRDGKWNIDIMWEVKFPKELRLFLVFVDEEGYTETEGEMTIEITAMNSFMSDLELAINNFARNYGLISEGLNLPNKETMDQVELPNVMDKEQKRYAKIGYRVGWIDAGKFRYGTVYQIFRLPGQEVVVVIQPDDIGNTSSIELPVSQLIAGAVL